MLEIIACSLNDAIAAEQGDADRIELISHFEVGGLTPDFELIREVLAAVKIPVRVMLRETENFQVTNEAEKKRLGEIAEKISALPIGGIVCGFLQGDAIDHALLSRIASAAQPHNITFHRAFEELSNPLQAIQELKKYPQIDCILTSGGQGTESEKIARLGVCEQMAAPEIMILAGGGMTDEMLRNIKLHTPIRDFHLGTFVREPRDIHGAIVPEKVREMVALVKT